MSLSDWFRRVPWTVVVCAVLLMLLGLSGIERGDALTGLGEFTPKQIWWIALALPVMLAGTAVSYRMWKPYAWTAYVIAIVFLILVFLFPAKWGSRRWIPLPLMNFQPSEMAKLAFILALARYLEYRENFRRLSGLVVPFIAMLVPMALILKEPDLGTSLMFLPVLFAMLFAAGARPRHLLAVVVVGIALLPVLFHAISVEQRSRITAVFQQHDGAGTPNADGYHLHQSKQVLSLGGWTGSQLGGTRVEDPVAYHLPACRTDFVICMVGERWGVAGTGTTLLVYLVLFGRGLQIAAATREPFGRLVAVGIVALLAAQTIVNTAMTVGLMPITGITLPLMSYGGSSLLFTAAALGLLMSVGMRRGYEMGSDPFVFRSRELAAG